MGQADIRISNAERDEAIATLGEHLSTGRLELDEYEERCGLAVVARTRGELETLFDDLPAPHPDLSSAAPPLMQKAGQLVPGRSKDLAQTPASKAFEAVAGVSILVGIPAAVLLTIFAGAWWVFLVVVAVFFVTAVCADAAKKAGGPQPEA